MKKLMLVLVSGLISVFSLSQAFAAGPNTKDYGTLSYANGTVKIKISGPTTLKAGRANFELQFVDDKGAAINDIATAITKKEIYGVSEMTSMNMPNGTVILTPAGAVKNVLKAVIPFGMSSMSHDDWKVTIVYKNEGHSFNVTVE